MGNAPVTDSAPATVNVPVTASAPVTANVPVTDSAPMNRNRPGPCSGSMTEPAGHVRTACNGSHGYPGNYPGIFFVPSIPDVISGGTSHFRRESFPGSAG